MRKAETVRELMEGTAKDLTIEEGLKLAEEGERFCEGSDIGYGHMVVGPSRILAIATALREMCARVLELEEKEGWRCGTCCSWGKPHEHRPDHRECDRLLVFTPEKFGCWEWERKP